MAVLLELGGGMDDRWELLLALLGGGIRWLASSTDSQGSRSTWEEKEGWEAGRAVGGGGAGCNDGVVEEDRELLTDLQGCH